MAGLVRKKVTVRGKKGTYQRSVMVRAGEAVKRTASKVAKFVDRHKGKIAAGVGAAALGAGALALAHKRGHIDLHGMASNLKELGRSAGGALKARAGGLSDRAKDAVGRARGGLSAARIDVRKSLDEGRVAAAMQYEGRRGAGRGRAFSAADAVKAGVATAVESLRGRRKARGGK